MRAEDLSLDNFYVRCSECGDQILSEGYHIGESYICDGCLSRFKIDGLDEAERLRDEAFENRP